VRIEVVAGRRFVCAVLAAALLALVAMTEAARAAPDPLRSQQWGLDLIRADQAHAVSLGAGALVAVVDTGVRTDHPDLAGRLLPGRDFVTPGATMHDGNGHGTHVTGIVAADEGNGIGVEGVAPLATVLPVRVLDDDGSGSETGVAQGVDWAVSQGAEVVNLSLGGLPISDVGQSDLGDAINRALDHGVVVVAAAGNDSVPVCEQPPTNGRLLCVGAIDRRGMHSFFSSFGLGVNVLAPGGSGLPGSDEDVLSTWNDGGYAFLAGTSQATPHVSGVAALLVSLGLRGQAVVKRILSTESSSGVLDAQAAVAGLAPPASAAPAPTTPQSTAAVAVRRPVARHRRRRRHRHHAMRARRHSQTRAHRSVRRR
jgi:subtilisin family serine protease